MEKIVILIISWLVFTSTLFANQDDFYSIAGEAIKGEKVYTLDEIESISSFKDIPQHQRTIVEVRMLMAADEEARYLRAVEKCTAYIETGTVAWARDYLLSMRGFCYGLLGKRELGAADLEDVLESGTIDALDKATDPVLEMLRDSQDDLALALDAAMRATVGNYYMDWRKEGIMPNEAYRYLSSIKIKSMREKNLEQLKNRMGDELYLKLVKSMEGADSGVSPDGARSNLSPSRQGKGSQKENGARSETSAGTQPQEVDALPASSPRHVSGSVLIVKWVGITTALAVAIVFLAKLKRRKGA